MQACLRFIYNNKKKSSLQIILNPNILLFQQLKKSPICTVYMDKDKMPKILFLKILFVNLRVFLKSPYQKSL